MSKIKRVEKGIYLRGPYQYQVKIRRNGAAVTATFETLALARQFLKVQTGKIVAHEYVDTRKERRTTLRSLLERYLAEVTPTKLGARQETNRIKAWMAHELGAYSVAGIETKDIADWIAQQVDAGKAPSTISNAVNVLSAVFKKGKEWGLKIDNPCTGVSRPTARPPRFAVMSEADQAQLVRACQRGPQWLPFVVRLALTTGMRQGEIRRLHWAHIHETHAHLPKTKNGRSRDVPLTNAAMAVINDIRRELPLKFDKWVFGNPDMLSADGGFTEWQVQQAFRAAAEYAEEHFGVERKTFHDLRHIALTALAELHTDVIELQRTSGHKTLAVLARYLNVTPDVTARRIREREVARQSSGK